MDILYGHLENYQDENVISELKNENQELKCKLEEYASNLARLQNDFDNLSAEYKKLESNYSSLLKTARAEIERKSQLITNLNLEKDKLVLESIQNRKWPHKRKFYNGGSQQTGNQSGKQAESAKQQQETAATSSFDKNITRNSPTLPYNNERKDKRDKKSSQNTNPKTEIDAKEKNQKFRASDYDKDGDFNKKNDNEEYPDNSSQTKSAVKVSKIKDRRKSMPLPNREDYKFSSDEDENDNLRDHRFRKKTPLRETIDRKHQETKHNGRHYPERQYPSEIPPAGDRRGGYDYDYSRDAYRRSNNWHRDNDKQRSRDNRDKYEASQRFRRRHSPDRPQCNMYNEYNNKHREPIDMPHWADRNRYRVLESPPPPDKYTHHRTSRDSDRMRFDRIHNPEAYSMKHKIPNVVEEPPTKRPRSESFNKQTDKHVNFQQDKDVCSRTAAAISKPLEFSYLSLQSPDHVHFENPPVHHIKEILSTANTKLDDPRLTSKKYVVGKYKDRVVLSTVGKDVDIKIIDTTKWDIDKDKWIHKLPSPLREKPPMDEDFMKDIYVGIDHPLSNISLESGEICLEDDEVDTWSYNKHRMTEENSINKKFSNNLPNQSLAQINVNKKEATATLPNTLQTSSTHLSKSYKIPRVNTQSSTKPLEDNISRLTYDKPSKNDMTKETYKKKSKRDRRDSDKKLQSEVQEHHYNPLKMFSDAIGVCKNKSNNFVDISQRKYSSEKALTTARDTVEGDLELSDETCDYTESADEMGHDREKIVQSEECNKNSMFGSINSELNSAKLEKKDSAEINVFKHGIAKPENKHFDIQEKGRVNHSKDSKEKNKPRKDDKPKDIKSKLCDLFGETSSLITPEDLGIAASDTTSTKENINEYTPLYDNTQDAVDLNIEEMEKVQTRSIKSKTDEPFAKDPQQDVTSDKKEKNIVKKTKKDEKQKSKNSSTITSPIHQMFQNINTEQAKENDGTVKTVIISTGIQNNPSSRSGHETLENQLTNIQISDAPKCPLLNLTALATSTPHKGAQLEPSLTIPDSSCNSSKSMTKEASDIASADRKRNLGEPDLRIIVKRRRKNKGKTS